MIESCKFMLGGMLGVIENAQGRHELFMLSLTTSRPVSEIFFKIEDEREFYLGNFLKSMSSSCAQSGLAHVFVMPRFSPVAGSSQLYIGLLRINSENVGGASPLLHVLPRARGASG